MTSRRIAYAELFVANHDEATSYLTELFQFRRIAVATGAAGRLSTALRNGGVTIVVTAEPGGGGEVSRFVQEHGDGVADLGLACSDVDAAFDSVSSSGERVHVEPTRTADGTGTYAVVGGFGDVRHTLMLDSGHPEEPLLPPDRRWEAVETVPGVEEPPAHRRLRTIDHVAVCVPAGELKSTVDLYTAAFDTPYYSSEYIQVGEQAMDSIVVRNASGGITLTLIEPDPSRAAGQIDQFLAANGGAGVQHLAFLVDDVVDSVQTLSERGVRFLTTPREYYDTLTERVQDVPAQLADLVATNVLADRDSWGYLLQIFSRSPYPRGTLFYELIQRGGARGFGSANIRALYEAVERSRATAAQ
jgi:4-hydroxymandelate synthase